jgi:hypothetical protein
MDIGRRAVVAGSGAAVALAAAGPSAAADAPPNGNPWARAIAASGDAIKAVMVSVDADGKSRITDTDIVADKSVAPKLLQQFLTHQASKVAIYRAPPHHAITVVRPPLAGKAAEEFLLIVDGNTTVKTDGGNRKIGSGTVMIFDGIANYKEQAGPAGYIAIKVLLAD